MKLTVQIKRILSGLLVLVMLFSFVSVGAVAAEIDDTLTASLSKAKSYTDAITINNSSNDPATVVKNFKTHFTWDNEKRENSKSYLFDWSYYNGVVFEGIEFLYEATGEKVYKDYVVEYMSSLINSNGGWATCSNNSSKQCAGYNSTHGADCYKTASLLLDAYEMTGDQRYLTMAKTLYTDLTNAAKTYSLKNAGQNFRHTWASDPSPDLWLDGLYMILPFRAEYAKYIGDTAELDLIVSRMQWVSDNMYNSGKKLFYHAADSASSNSGTYWLRSIGWYAAAIVDIMDHMEGQNLEAMKKQLVKLVDGMKACQNASNGMWLNNMNAAQSSSNPYETSGTALTCYAVIKAVNKGWLDKSYADMAILAFNGICREKLSGTTLKDICFKGAPGSSNSTFYNNEGKGVGPFIMFYAEMLNYVNNNRCDHSYTSVTKEPTCVAAGSVTYTCTGCGDSYAEEIPATGVHTYKSVTVDATETTDGSVTYTCTGCGHSYSEMIPATGETQYTLDTLSGTVEKGAASGANTGAQVVITTASGRKSYETVTLAMITDGSGKAVSSAVSGTFPNLTVTYQGKVLTNAFTLTVEPQWIAMPSGHTYTLDTDGVDLGSGNKYLVVGADKNYALTLSGTTVGNKAVTIKNNTITLDDNAGYEFYFVNNSKESNTRLLTQDGSKTVYHMGGNMYYGSDSKGYWYITSNGNGSYKVYDYDNCNWYLNYGYVWGSDAANRFAVSSTSRNVRLFKYTGSGSGNYARLNGETSQYYTTASATAESTVLGKLKIQTSTNGSNTASTLSVTSDMISWNTPFKGTAAGTYIGTVTYEGVNLGTVTVTISLEHRFETVTKEPTCTEKGSITTRCTVCGEQTVEEIPALGHDYSCTVTEATCDRDGSKVYTCGTCGHSYSEAIPAAGHDYSSVTVDPTCTEAGSVTSTCGICGNVTVEKIPALNHDFETHVTEATCSENGSREYSCKRCDFTYSQVIPATGNHVYESVTQDPTCAGEGSTVYTCQCGHSYTEVIPATGKHDYKTTTVDATVTEDGAIIHTCTGCGHSYSEVIPAIGETTYTLSTKRGTVTRGAGTAAVTGAQITIANNHGSSVVDVTVGMLTNAAGKTVSTAAADTLTGLTLTCEGNVVTKSFTLEITETDAGWVALPKGYTYVLDTDGMDAGSGNKYLVVGETANQALTLSGTTVGNKAVTVKDNTITLENPSGYEFYFQKNGSTYLLTQNGSSTVYHANANMYYGSNSAGNWTVTHNGNGKYKVLNKDGNGNWSLNYGYVWGNDASTKFSVSYYDRYVRLFKLTGDAYDGYARLSGALKQTYSDLDKVTEDTVLGKVLVQTSSNGSSVSGVLDLTKAMISWNKTFNGAAEGTYTGTVTYGKQNIGTVTVTIVHEHSYETVTLEPTCTKAGSVTTTCASCGNKTVETIPALGHSYETVTVEPTCTEAGSVTTTCTKCDFRAVETIAATGHDYEIKTLESTCGAEGSVTYTCHCGHSYAEVIPATGEHSYTQEILEATCAKDGLITGTCEGCGHVTMEVIPATGEHVYEETTVDATCGADGSVTYRCAGCDDTYVEVIPATGDHDYSCVTLEPTCTETGSHSYSCEVCGHHYVDVIAALGHSYVSETTAATCTEGGFTTYTCTACGHSYAETETEALGHDYESVITATCTESGWEVFTCRTCGHSYNGEKVEALGHSCTETTVEPTCSTDGYTTYVCTACGHSYTGNVVPAAGHDYEAMITGATCTEGGHTEFTCTACGHSYVGDYTAALGHDYESIVTEPTYEEMGYTTHTCRRCGDVTVDSYVPVRKHSYDMVTVEATCTQDGSVTYTCNECDDVYTEVLPALGHDTETVVTEGDCVHDGYIVTTCQRCGEEEIEVIEAPGHDFETVIIDPSCTADGYITDTCSVCGHMDTETIPALGHDYVTEVLEPTCTEAGATTYTCTVCDHSYQEAIAAPGHRYSSEAVAPTCTEEGYTIYSCDICGHSYVDDEVAALGHSHKAQVIAPTCTEGGFTAHVCEFCGDRYTDSETEATGHSYTSEEVDGYMVYTCHCGHTYSELLPPKIVYGLVTAFQVEGRYVIALTMGDSAYALAHSETGLVTVPVTVMGDRIVSEVTEDMLWNYADGKLSADGSEFSVGMFRQMEE